jgi:hypothetical protein
MKEQEMGEKLCSKNLKEQENVAQIESKSMD